MHFAKPSITTLLTQIQSREFGKILKLSDASVAGQLTADLEVGRIAEDSVQHLFQYNCGIKIRLSLNEVLNLHGLSISVQNRNRIFTFGITERELFIECSISG